LLEKQWEVAPLEEVVMVMGVGNITVTIPDITVTIPDTTVVVTVCLFEFFDEIILSK